ncbi:DEAD/DEAH box helicase [Candidatus Woesearchaeota archaeon]|nr:DEAD/DEAH box helicase [Candidatus Woesearchaeota archaeon]
MQYKKFTLDKFQVDAIDSIEKGNSVVVSASTGTGKTLIADYIIDKYIKKNRRIIYTAPIKALSSQKYRDFKEEYGEDKIGLMTGDIVINPQAPIIVMTTEIYRNMLITKDPCIDYISYVIFDEIHFINDIERGTIWEESIIFSPPHIRFLCLSATIPNKVEFADWICKIKNHTVDVVENVKRAVPLNHSIYDPEKGLTDINLLIKEKKRRKKKYGRTDEDQLVHIDLIDILFEKKLLPAIYFNFSRKQCEYKAKELSKNIDFLNSNEKKEVIGKINEIVPNNLKVLKSFSLLKKTLTKGIGFHHAGIVPKFKELVEILFGNGLVKVLYATETFAVGINMPAKTVCFASLLKYDGVNTRYLNSKEYFQLAGRAGRRGIDKIGNAIAVIDNNNLDLERIKKFTTRDIDPIISQFKLSINTVLNLVYIIKKTKLKQY